MKSCIYQKQEPVSNNGFFSATTKFNVMLSSLLVRDYVLLEWFFQILPQIRAFNKRRGKKKRFMRSYVMNADNCVVIPACNGSGFSLKRSSISALRILPVRTLIAT